MNGTVTISLEDFKKLEQSNEIAQKLKEKCSVEFGHSLNIDGKTLKVCRVSQLHYKRIEHKLTDREKSNY